MLSISPELQFSEKHICTTITHHTQTLRVTSRVLVGHRSQKFWNPRQLIVFKDCHFPQRVSAEYDWLGPILDVVSFSLTSLTSILVTCSSDPGLSPPPHSIPAGMAEVEISLMSDTSRAFTTPFVCVVWKAGHQYSYSRVWIRFEQALGKDSEFTHTKYLVVIHFGCGKYCLTSFWV